MIRPLKLGLFTRAHDSTYITLIFPDALALVRERCRGERNGRKAK